MLQVLLPAAKERPGTLQVLPNAIERSDTLQVFPNTSHDQIPYRYSLMPGNGEIHYVTGTSQ